jgi:spore coat protein SA
VPYKGLELLLRAVAHLRRHVNVKLLIVGSGNRETVGYFRRVATALETTSEVDFVGHVGRAELLGIYQAADLFCMPSIETYGLSILEAMSCGCVPVVADWNGPGEIVESEYGVKVALSDPEQFVIDYAERIVGMMDSPDMRKEMASRARETVIARHSWDKLLMVIGEAYRELLL